MSSSETMVYDNPPVDLPSAEPPGSETLESVETTEAAVILSNEEIVEDSQKETSEEIVESEREETTDRNEQETETTEPVKESVRRTTPRKFTRLPAQRRQSLKARLNSQKIASPVASKHVVAKAKSSTRGQAKNQDQPLFEDPNLPASWRRCLIQRQSGVSAGKYDVYIYSPDNKRFRSRTELSSFLVRSKSEFSIDDFDFTVFGRSGESPSKPRFVKPEPVVKIKAKRGRPVTKHNSTTAQSKKLVVKLNFGGANAGSKKGRKKVGKRTTVVKTGLPSVKTAVVKTGLPSVKTAVVKTGPRQNKPFGRRKRKSSVNKKQLGTPAAKRAAVAKQSVSDEAKDPTFVSSERSSDDVDVPVAKDVEPNVCTEDGQETATEETPEVASQETAVECPEAFDEEVVNHSVTKRPDDGDRNLQDRDDVQHLTNGMSSPIVIETALKCANTDLYNMVKNMCVRALWKLK